MRRSLFYADARPWRFAGGAFSLVKKDEAQPGLSIIPPYDDGYWEDHERCDDIYVCDDCGLRSNENTTPRGACPNCGNEGWKTAVK